MGLSEDLLLQALNGLREDVQGVREKQDTMKDELHAAVLGNTTAVSALNTRMGGVESSMKRLKADVRKDAKRWGAVGGAFSTACAILVMLVKSFLRGPHV